jgi:CubicO group peptidase (beta-lactamase class C family)
MSQARLDEVSKLVQSQYPHLFGLLVVRHGRVVYERFFAQQDPNALYPVHSVTKSVTSTLIGIAFDQGLVQDLDERVSDILPEYFKKINNPDARDIRIRHLLSMSAGLDWPSPEDWNFRYGTANEWIRSNDWVSTLFSRKMVSKPGEKFRYNTAVSHQLSVILSKKAGMPTPEFARRYFFEPLNIKRYRWATKNGVLTGGHGLELSIYDLAKLGQLYLQKGKWNGRQIVSERWVQKATSASINCGFRYKWDAVKYGYQWWVFPVNKIPSFRAIGRGGQFVVVIPELDMVIAVNSVVKPDYRNVFIYSPLFDKIARSVNDENERQSETSSSGLL